MIALEDVRVLHLEPTTLCNAGCPQCSRYLDDGSYNPALPEASLSLEWIKKTVPLPFVNQLDKMFMCGTFGEPAAAKDALQIFQWFRTVNSTITLGMNTNGSLRTTEWWQELATVLSLSQDYVVFSIDGLEDTNHIYRRNTSWKKIINNAQAFIAAGGSAHWDMLVFDHNAHQVDQARQMAKDLGFRWFRTKVTNRFDTRKISWLKPIESPSLTTSSNLHCRTQVHKEIYLSSHGLMLPCCYIGEELYAPNVEQRRQNLLSTLGNIESYNLSSGLEQIVNSFDKISSKWNDGGVDLCSAKCSEISGSSRSNAQWVTEEQLQ
jgi:sulfatase maturation enzyme AslB (radical SAM superfamily)